MGARGRHSRSGGAKMLAASFVVTFAATGCKKESKVSAAISVDPSGRCFRNVFMDCPRGATCNPPPPDEIDCPPSHHDAAAPPISARRPAGKEGWLRMKPRFWQWPNGCAYTPETFCAPVTSSTTECSPRAENVKVDCVLENGAAKSFGSFVYKDGFGECRRIPGGECKLVNGTCEVPEGDVVPCEPKPPEGHR